MNNLPEFISPKVRLLVNGIEHGGWKKVRISAGIERQARDFELGITDRWPGQLTDIPQRVRYGDTCELFIGEQKVLTGYVDATPITYDSGSVTVSVRGRSKTADLIDCSAITSPGQFKRQKIEAIAAALAKPYDVTVVAETDTGDVIQEHQIQQCETVFESIDRMLRLRNLLSTDDEFGRLILIKVGALKAFDSLELGQNILGSSAPLDGKNRFSKYICKGQKSGTDNDWGKGSTANRGVALDDGVTRLRVLQLQQSGQADGGTCQQRVDYEMQSRAAKSIATEYTHAGWLQSNGELWKPNMQVRVIDTLIGFDRVMVISEVEYSLDEGGSICTLRVAPAVAFRPPPKGKKKKGTKTGGDSWDGVVSADDDDGDEDNDSEE